MASRRCTPAASRVETAQIALDTQLLQEGIYLSTSLGREITADEIRALSVSKAIEVPNLYL
jgi:hypothetical protein